MAASDPRLDPRTAAVALLDAVLGQGRALSDLADEVPPLSLLATPPDRARARRLATLTLRHLARADALLGPHLRKTPPLAVRNALRLATVEIHEIGAEAHGPVNAAVAAMGASRRTAHAAGLVNAVLRKVAEAPGWAALPPPRLPGWLRGRVLSAYGAQTTAAIERAHLAGAPLDLTARDGDGPTLAARLGGQVTPTGSVRLAEAGQVSALAGYAEGDWWVQDAAAALPARILAPRTGERVADLCAAPGGKTLQMAATGALVTAVDVSGPRLSRVADNLARCGLSASLVTADALTWEPEAPPDAILLDAPCSATGTIRRHPELPHIRDGSILKGLVALQAALLDRAVALLPAGGRMVYATCSLLPEEGETQVRAVLSRHPGLAADPDALRLPGLDPGWVTPEGGLRLRPDYWPDAGGMDGFYIAHLRKAV